MRFWHRWLQLWSMRAARWQEKQIGETRNIERNPGKDGMMPKYQVLVAASGKHGSALLPYVLVDCKNAQNAARRAVSMARIAYPEYDKFEARKPEVISGE